MKNKKQKVVYIHTIIGKPAQFHLKDRMIYYANARGITRPALSLVQIRKERLICIATRSKKGWSTSGYGHVVVRFPTR